MPTESETKIYLPPLHPGQAEVLAQARRFNVAACGRRWGKNVLAQLLVVRALLELRGRVGWFSPIYKTLSDDWRYFGNLLAPVTQTKAEVEKRLVTVTGGVLEMWSLDSPDVTRGRAYHLVILDEAATVAHLQNAWENVIVPMLADYQGLAWFFSTPNGFNYFKTLYDRGQDPEHEEWASWQRPTSENPHIPSGEIELAQRTLPQAVFAQEYLAHFIAGTGQVFRNLMECATATQQRGKQPGHNYVIGVDWGQQKDFTAFAVWDTTTRELVYLVRLNLIDYELQSNALRGLVAQFKPDVVVVEENSIGRPIMERLQYDVPVRGWTTTNKNKALLVNQFQLALERRELRIIADPVLLAELQAFQATKLETSGLTRYAAPEGGHDDTVMAAMLGWSEVTKYPPPVQAVANPIVSLIDDRDPGEPKDRSDSRPAGFIGRP